MIIFMGDSQPFVVFCSSGALQKEYMWPYPMRRYIHRKIYIHKYTEKDYLHLPGPVRKKQLPVKSNNCIWCNSCSSRQDLHCWKTFWESTGVHWAKTNCPVLQSEFHFWRLQRDNFMSLCINPSKISSQSDCRIFRERFDSIGQRCCTWPNKRYASFIMLVTESRILNNELKQCNVYMNFALYRVGTRPST